MCFNYLNLLYLKKNAIVTSCNPTCVPYEECLQIVLRGINGGSRLILWLYCYFKTRLLLNCVNCSCV